MFFLCLDMSDDWRYIAAVVTVRRPHFVSCSHVARVGRRRRWRIVRDLLDFVEENGYGVCVFADLRSKVKSFAVGTVNRGVVWRRLLRFELVRVRNHLMSKGYWPIDTVFADNEFAVFRDVLVAVFRTRNVVIGKNEYVALADVVAYMNFRDRRFLKRYRRISEIV